ncbi:hypothetical protein MMC14_002388 [Varicellaria rhodocarpa]|nr:hypothetical protein [Varicellaria rhodocarpa]
MAFYSITPTASNNAIASTSASASAIHINPFTSEDMELQLVRRDSGSNPFEVSESTDNPKCPACLEAGWDYCQACRKPGLRGLGGNAAKEDEEAHSVSHSQVSTGARGWWKVLKRVVRTVFGRRKGEWGESKEWQDGEGKTWLVRELEEPRKREEPQKKKQWDTKASRRDNRTLMV